MMKKSYIVGEYDFTTELENNLNAQKDQGYKVKFIFPPDMSQSPAQPKYVVIFALDTDKIISN